MAGLKLKIEHSHFQLFVFSLVYRIPLNETSFGLSPIFSAVVDGGGSIPEKYSLSLAELPHSGAIGMMRNGVPIFPSHDNADYTSWEACEGDRCSSHAGRGGTHGYLTNIIFNSSHHL